MTTLSDFHKRKYEKAKKQLINAANEHLFNTNAMIGVYETNSIMKTLLNKDRTVCTSLLDSMSCSRDANSSDSSSIKWSTSPSKTESYSIRSVSSSDSLKSFRSASSSRSSTSSSDDSGRVMVVGETKDKEGVE